VPLNPFAQEGIRNLDFQRVTVIAYPKANNISEPEIKAQWPKSVAQSGAQFCLSSDGYYLDRV
jgi:hypothetical protein